METGADIGLAFDGDADRVLAVDENGEIVDGDKIIAICSLHMRKHGRLKDSTAVVTVMSNLGLFKMAEENGISLKATKVGDRYVLEEMINKGYSLGGEQSGHVIFLEYNTTGDGLITGLQLLYALKESNTSLSQAAEVMKTMPQVLINAKVKNELKNSYMEDDEIRSCCEQIENEFENNGRVIIRTSGTEPLVRVMIEGEDINVITEKARHLADLIEKKLG